MGARRWRTFQLNSPGVLQLSRIASDAGRSFVSICCCFVACIRIGARRRRRRSGEALRRDRSAARRRPVVERATVLGLLGPNGAGKTTAVRILTTLLKPDAGRAFIDGIDVVAEPRRARARIGLTGQYAAVDERLTGYENLEHVGRLFHLSEPSPHGRAGELLERFDLVEPPTAPRAPTRAACGAGSTSR